MKRYVNHAPHPIVFDDGTTLAAAGTDGSIKNIESITDADRARYVNPSLVVEMDVPVDAKSQTAPAATTRSSKEVGS
jgi:hypothetical protein